MQNRYQQLNTNSALPIERIIAALSYLTSGAVGFVWFLLAIFTKNTLRPFLKYHIFQSIFLAIAFFLASQFLGLVLNILSHIPLLNILIMQVNYFLTMPLIVNFSIIEILIFSVVIYLAATSLQGQYSYIPWVSDIIKANVKNS